MVKKAQNRKTKELVEQKEESKELLKEPVKTELNTDITIKNVNVIAENKQENKETKIEKKENMELSLDMKNVEEKLTDDKKLDIEEEIDSRSIFLKNVDFSATPEDIEEHFKSYGSVNRITIICDKFTGIPKGYAYVEFASVEEKEKSKQLNDSLFKGRQIKIEDKRKNIPNFYGKKIKKYKPPMYPQPMMMRGVRGGFFGGSFRGRGMPIRGMSYKPHFNK